jgi:hypothetical protein
LCQQIILLAKAFSFGCHGISMEAGSVIFAGTDS